ncbi:MAG: methyltransferase domain-containing protein [Pseudomonadota bacterium]
MTDENYEWDAKDYEKHSSAQYEWARELIAKLRPKGTESVLDIGCGDGKVTAAIAACVPEGNVLGIDSSEGMISLARERHPEGKYGNLAFRLMDARVIDFDNQFDVVFSNAALHWVKDHLNILARVKKCMRRDGRMLFQMGGKGNAKDILDVLDEMNNDQWGRYFRDFAPPYGFYGPEEYRSWLAAAGLEAKRIELIPKDMKYKDKDGLAGWIRTTWLPYLERIPVERKETFVREIVERYVKMHPPDGEGNVCVKMVRLEVEATNH